MSNLNWSNDKLCINLSDKDAFVMYKVEHLEGVRVWKLIDFFRRRRLESMGLLTRKKMHKGPWMHVLTPLGREYMAKLKQKLEAELMNDEGPDAL